MNGRACALAYGLASLRVQGQIDSQGFAGIIIRSTANKHVHRRYLVHAIAHYYNLKTWSVSTTDGRREAYVGLKEDPVTRRPSLVKSELPRPLWAVV